MKKFLSLLISTLVLAGCAQVLSTTPIPAVTKPFSPSVTQAFSSNTPRPTPTFTLTPPAATATSTGMPAPEDVAADIDRQLSQMTERGEFSGSVLIARDGKILLSKGYGLADRENNIQNAPQTQFCIASVTKTFTAMVVLMLQNRGLLDVQDPFCNYYPYCPSAWQGITIHQLLTHTSGIPDYIYLPDAWDFALTPMPGEDLIARFRDLPLDFPPGTSYSYDNSGYILLGEIIERVSGQSYDDFLEENIFDPLGMINTTLDPGKENVAIGYDDSSNKPSLPDVRLGTGADGSIYSTVEDLFRWDRALSTEILIPQALLDQMFTVHPSTVVEESGYGYGYGWEIPPAREYRFFQHTGNTFGFKAYLGRVPDYRITVILLINQHNIRPRPLGDAIVQELVDGKSP